MNKILKESIKLAHKNIVSYEVLAVRGRSSSASEPPITEERLGLSKSVVNVPKDEEVGFPGASKAGVYKNPEYFCYHSMSFYEAEIEMKKYRGPQPSNKVAK